MSEATTDVSVLYEEVQDPIWPFKAITLGAGAGAGMAMARALSFGLRLGVAGLVAGGVGALAGEFAFPMRTTVLTDEVQIRFGRRTRFRIPLKHVVRAYSRTYHPIREYGGWGIRSAPNQSRAFNMRGDQGVQLVLRSGMRVLIGSQTPDALAEALRKAARCEGDGEDSD
jgi:hypothetical protein